MHLAFLFSTSSPCFVCFPFPNPGPIFCRPHSNALSMPKLPPLHSGNFRMPAVRLVGLGRTLLASPPYLHTHGTTMEQPWPPDSVQPFLIRFWPTPIHSIPLRTMATYMLFISNAFPAFLCARPHFLHWKKYAINILKFKKMYIYLIRLFLSKSFLFLF